MPETHHNDVQSTDVIAAHHVERDRQSHDDCQSDAASDVQLSVQSCVRADEQGGIGRHYPAFVKRFAENMAKRIRRIDKQTLELCERYAWLGNIRELQNIVERSVILCSGDTFSIDEAWLSQAPFRPDPTGALPGALQVQEKEMIEGALVRSGGKVAGPKGAAATLGVPASTSSQKSSSCGSRSAASATRLDLARRGSRVGLVRRWRNLVRRRSQVERRMDEGDRHRAFAHG
jgi:hypothetical protein